MINLKAAGGPTDIIRLVLGAGATVAATVDFVDMLAAGATQGVPDRQFATCAASATTTICGSPLASPDTRRNATYIHLKQLSLSASVAARLERYDGTNAFIIDEWTFLPGDTYIITESGIKMRLDAAAQQYVSIGTPVDPRTNDFRLSGVSATPVMTADSTTLSTVYLAQFKGNRIALRDTNGNWQLVMPAAEASLAVTGRTGGTPFDIFGYLSGGTVVLEFLDWTNGTTRATGLTRVDGIWTKTGDATRRYLGSCLARSATTFHWVMAGSETGSVKLDLFNADNRIRFSYQLILAVNTWAYTLATWRQVQADADCQVEIMQGLQEECLDLTAIGTSANSTTSIARRTGIGADSTTAASGLFGGSSGPANIECQTEAELSVIPTIGKHFYAMLEHSTATGVCTWYGDNGALLIQSGMKGTFTC